MIQTPTGGAGKAQGAPQARPRKRRWLRWPIRVLIILVVFAIGVDFGNGTISLKSHQGLSGNLPRTPDYSSVTEVYRSLIYNYDGRLNETQLENGLKHGLAESTNDPYTEYFTPKEARDFNAQLNNSFSGVGAQLGKDKDQNLEVIAPIAGLPAAKAGLKPGDLITEINGKSTAGMSIDDAVSQIRGKKGTKVTLQVVRGRSQTLNVTITRDDIKLPSVNTKIIDGNIGYMQITDFSDDTASLADKAAGDFRAKHVKGVILDLRDDGGGLLDAAVHVSSLWLPEGRNVLKEKRGNTVTNNYDAVKGAKLNGIPTVVLINDGTASASEITAGALHDNHAAYLIGQKSYGKGVVQQLISFKDGSQLKVTIASWYRPDGQNINHKGITPDQIVNLTDAQSKAGNDTQLNAAKAYLAAH